MRPEHDEDDWKQISKDMNYVKDHSRLKPSAIYKRIGVPPSHFSNIWKHAKGGLKAPKRRILTEMVNETRIMLGEEPIPLPPKLDLDQGTPIEITSRELDIRVLKELVREKVWIVQIRLNEPIVK